MDFKHAVAFNHEKCKKLIMQKGFSLTTFSFLTNISYAHLSKIVSGFYPCHNLTTINKIASVLDVNPNEFLEIY